jgi:hypothetical protein
MPRKPKRKYLKYSTKLANHVCEEMESGKNLIDICTAYNSKLAEGEATLKPNSIHKWKRDHAEFKEQYNTAYESRIQYLSEYIDAIAHEPLPDTGDHKRDNLELTRKKMIIDTIKFELAKLNSHRFKQVVEVQHQNAPNIVVQSYSTPNALEPCEEATRTSCNEGGPSSKNDELH